MQISEGSLQETGSVNTPTVFWFPKANLLMLLCWLRTSLKCLCIVPSCQKADPEAVMGGKKTIPSHDLPKTAEKYDGKLCLFLTRMKAWEWALRCSHHHASSGLLLLSLHPVLVFSVQEKEGTTGESPVESLKDD